MEIEVDEDRHHRCRFGGIEHRACTAGSGDGTSRPKHRQNDGRYALIVDGAPYLMLGMQTEQLQRLAGHAPAGVARRRGPACQTRSRLPSTGSSSSRSRDSSTTRKIDTILAQARAHHVHLVLLWFGTWKNGSQHYMPEWMKLEPQRYSHVVNKRGEPVDSPSPIRPASLDADMHAFTAFMTHLKAADPERHGAHGASGE